VGADQGAVEATSITISQPRRPRKSESTIGPSAFGPLAWYDAVGDTGIKAALYAFKLQNTNIEHNANRVKCWMPNFASTQIKLYRRSSVTSRATAARAASGVKTGLGKSSRAVSPAQRRSMPSESMPVIRQPLPARPSTRCT
jgi:hypothetical protein